MLSNVSQRFKEWWNVISWMTKRLNFPYFPDQYQNSVLLLITSNFEFPDKFLISVISSLVGNSINLIILFYQSHGKHESKSCQTGSSTMGKNHHTMRLLREILVKFPRKFEETTYRTLQNKPQRYQKTGTKTGEIKSLLTNF